MPIKFFVPIHINNPAELSWLEEAFNNFEISIADTNNTIKKVYVTPIPPDNNISKYDRNKIMLWCHYDDNRSYSTKERIEARKKMNETWSKIKDLEM